MGKLLDNLCKKHADVQGTTKRHTLSFLAHRDEIAEALNGGWTVKQIWEQMIEDGMITMSYGNLCRLVKKHITSSMHSANAVTSPASASPFPSVQQEKSRENTSTKKSTPPERKLTEKERLDLMKEEAFASVRSTKPTRSLITKPKTREEENRELFG